MWIGGGDWTVEVRIGPKGGGGGGGVGPGGWSFCGGGLHGVVAVMLLVLRPPDCFWEV